MEEGPALAQLIKGREYILAIVFNVAFIGFWLLLNRRGRPAATRDELSAPAVGLDASQARAREDAVGTGAGR